MASEGLTAREEETLTELIQKLGDRMTDRLYNAIAAKFALTAIEAVTLREHNNRLEVLLLRRSDNDAHYPGHWHSPGSMLRASDAPPNDDTQHSLHQFGRAFQRIAKEIGCDFAGFSFASFMYLRTPRGPELAMIFLSDLVEDNPPNGKFFPVTHLPEPFVDHHRHVLKKAVEVYRERNPIN